MAQKCTLVISDHVNVKFVGLDPFVRRKLVDALKYLVPYARHMPAFKLGRWDGKVAFCTVGGGTYLNMLDTALPIVIDAGYEIEIDDRRPDVSFAFPEVTEDFLADTVWPKGHPIAGQPIMLRDYQVGAIKRYLDNPQSIQSISTGAGKTIITAALSKLCEPYGRTLVVVPSKSLVVQTEEDYRNIGLDVGVYFGERKEVGHKHTIATWQSLSSFAKKDKKEADFESLVDPAGFAKLIEGVTCVMIDECHSARGNELKSLLTGPLAHVPIRWGLTGTVPKGEWEFANLLVGLGPVVGEIKAADLQEQGVLADCHINIIQLDDSHVEYKSYDEENEFLTTDPTRLRWVAKEAQKVAESGNTLILVNRIESGETLHNLIPGSVFVNGSTKMDERSSEYKSIQTAENKVLIATYGVASTGISITRLFNIFLFECGKSFTRTIQSIGRGLRKGSGKEDVAIYDICSTAKFSKKHLAARKAFYTEARYSHDVAKIKYR